MQDKPFVSIEALEQYLYELALKEVAKQEDKAKGITDAFVAGVNDSKEPDSYIGHLNTVVTSFGYDALMWTHFRERCDRFRAIVTGTSDIRRSIEKERERALKELVELRAWNANSTNPLCNVDKLCRADAFAKWLECLHVITVSIEYVIEENAKREANYGKVYALVKGATIPELAVYMQLRPSIRTHPDQLDATGRRVVREMQDAFLEFIRIREEKGQTFATPQEAFEAYETQSYPEDDCRNLPN